jgi:hypothetical protein
MAALAANNPTLLDHAKALDPDGSIAAVVEILNQTNEMLADMTFVEGNLPTGHRTTIRTGLPAPTWRKLYGGVQPTKSTREQVTDTCGMLEAYAEVDKALADLNGNTNEFRLSEARAHLEGISQELQQTAIYGDTTVNPERFDGLEMRYNALTGSANSDNVIDGGSSAGQTDNRSIWLVVWGPETCHGIIPKGSTAGIQVNDKGQVTIENADGNNGRMEGYRTHFRLDAGLCVKDWRYVVRIANIDKSTLLPDASSGAVLPDLMFEAMEIIPSMSMGRPVFYMSRDVRTIFRQQLAALTKQSTLSYENVGGIKSMMFNEVPIRRVDKLAVDETRLT